MALVPMVTWFRVLDLEKEWTLKKYVNRITASVGGQSGACGGESLGQEHIHGLRGLRLDSQF